ncbi:MAG: bifunctional acetaldehyde-CoA/alcohol dehydrogenase, partial [Chloroflexi bacterium]|nr:bifunctional acetaldehyde-CoA/alcohol dehydrogenase [Chloroflexota bacterium]
MIETTALQTIPTYSLLEEEAYLQGARNIDELHTLIARVKQAQAIFATYSQEAVDRIFREASLAASAERISLAKEAVAETGMGIVEDKVIKNHFASEYIYNKYRGAKTCGVIESDPAFGIQKVAEPVGVICGIVPTTNPTSTTIFKALIALKTRNGIIFSPHPRAKKSTTHAAQIILEAAVRAGAPAGIIGWIGSPTIELTNALMADPGINLILATGGPGMVKAAYSSGKPAIGVGAGNTPALLDETADIRMAVNSIIMSKTFDNGVVCASEQCVIVHQDIYPHVIDTFKRRDGYLLSPAEKEQVAQILLDPKQGTVNPMIVGQPAVKIAAMAGLQVPESTKVLIGEFNEVSIDEPFAHEKLSPLLGLMKCSSFEEGVNLARRLVELGGVGHTSVLYTDPMNQERINRFGAVVKTGRVLINMPSSQGAIGDIYNFRLEPSLTLGCGSWGGNSVSENVGVKHLLNIKSIAERRENMLWFRVPPKVYHKHGCLPVALQELEGKQRAFIITDGPLFNLGYADRVTSILEPMGIECECFHQVMPDPTLSTIHQGLEALNAFKPDVIIALGGGSPMDAAKIMWLLYENPDVKFEGLALRFMDIRKRIYTFPNMGTKAILVTIPTTSGTGSEVTPFAVITDDNTGFKYPIADYALTPNIAIVDSDLVMGMPKALTAASGIDAVTHALEAIVSVLATDYTNSMALEALRILFKYLPAAYENGNEDAHAREKVHNAATMAGMAFANAFLGICHSMAHKLGAAYHVPHGVANALLISHVIRFNATDNPTKQTSFPQYEYPNAQARYA